MEKKKIVLGWGQIVLGLLVFSLGIHLTIFANIGLLSWDCLGMGISLHTPLNYGLSMTAIGVTVLIVDLLLRERIGFGTVIDALLTGNFVQMFNDLNPFPLNENFWLGIVILLAGLVVAALGMWIYMAAGQCCGPRDALLVGLGKRVPKMPIGLVEILIFGGVLLIGWLLGGPVGIGTLIGTFGIGFAIQLVFSLVGFEPRNVRHRSVRETLQILAGKDPAEN
ncbi:MAG: hypothetical protein IJH47_09165 [Oscillospiraceae bacterium]|nr:hypothetical protein [Oscillospiraceae bacterium]